MSFQSRDLVNTQVCPAYEYKIRNLSMSTNVPECKKLNKTEITNLKIEFNTFIPDNGAKNLFVQIVCVHKCKYTLLLTSNKMMKEIVPTRIEIG